MDKFQEIAEVEAFLIAHPGFVYINEDNTEVYVIVGDDMLVMIPGEYANMTQAEIEVYMMNYLHSNSIIRLN